jgi:hypothetical protein
MIPTPLTRVELLHKLEQRIAAETTNGWLFPQRRTVKGFYGTGSFVIVGWRPAARSTFPDDGANKLLYDILAEYGLENSHLTNVVKSRGEKDEPDPTDYALHKEIFLRELDILGAPYAVAPMGNAYDRVKALLSARGISPIAQLPQYASMNYGPDSINKFRRGIADLAALARRNGWNPPAVA